MVAHSSRSRDVKIEAIAKARNRDFLLCGSCGTPIKGGILSGRRGGAQGGARPGKISPRVPRSRGPGPVPPVGGGRSDCQFARTVVKVPRAPGESGIFPLKRVIMSE